MAIYFDWKTWKSLEKDINTIFDYVKENSEKTELLVSDIQGTLMNSMRSGCYVPSGMISSWKGLSSRDIGFAPKGAKYKSEIEYVGPFVDVLKHFGYEIKWERHGSGAKYIASKN